MTTMQVDVFDSVLSTIPPGPTFWSWPIDWEYLSLTLIPTSANGNVMLESVSVSSTSVGERSLNFTVQNNTSDKLDRFVTLTLPHNPVM